MCVHVMATFCIPSLLRAMDMLSEILDKWGTAQDHDLACTVYSFYFYSRTVQNHGKRSCNCKSTGRRASEDRGLSDMVPYCRVEVAVGFCCSNA